MPSPNFTCWLIGADSLLEECGELLLRSGHEIHGVVAPAGKIADWARSRGLATIEPTTDYGAVLAAKPFDYLFAITHLALVPDRVLRMPKRCAINFHDGPLPDYAGLNAPVWALIHREPRYAISWHQMTPMVDAGDVLKQRAFDVAADETALSLHAKCFEAALESFGELVGELATQTFQPVAQDSLQRRYFERHRRPAAACAIDWSAPAVEIEALVRALGFGPYPNPIGLATLTAGGQAIAVTRARAQDAGDCVPGTVLSIEDDAVVVAAGRGAIALSEFAELDGRSLTPGEVAQRLGLTAGARIESLAPDSARRLTELNWRMSRSERFWIQRLRTLDAATLPCKVAPTSTTDSNRAAALEVRVPAELAESAGGHPLSTVLTAAFCAYTGRIARKATFDIGYWDLALRGVVSGLEPWIAELVPMRVELRGGERFADFVQRIDDTVTDVRWHGPWLRDLIARQPELQRLRGQALGSLLPLAIERCAMFDEPVLREGAEWTFEVSDELCACRFVYDDTRIDPAHARSIQRGFEAFLASLASESALPIGAHDAVDADELERQLRQWSATADVMRRDACVHQLFEEQVQRTPEATAIVCDGQFLTYAELDWRAKRLAAELRELGVRPGSLVGICVERSLDLVVAVLGVLSAGGAYVPLDPAFPAARLQFMVEDAQLAVIVAQQRTLPVLPQSNARVLAIDSEWSRIAARTPRTLASDATPSDLAYAIYTSGSTGTPKGVLLEHRQVASFFAAIDERVPHDPPGVWLAVTSLSFDISVLELLWTLTRGFKVVIRAGRDIAARSQRSAPGARRDVAFSLFYFASDEGDDRGDAYRLLLEGARFADEHGFAAVWTPERHFHAFGGLYPNPAVTGAALAAITKRVQIRAGSVVLPLHHPIRVAEEWSVVDNISGGRVGISFASGWHPNDFVLAPQNREHAKDVMVRDIDVVRRLWRGETVAFPGPSGADVDVRTLPHPVQKELPVWITSAGNIETYALAGTLGANVLTHLLGQSIEQLAPKIAAYRDARAKAGLDPSTGVVSLMLHTFVGEDEARVRELVREPLERYLGSSLSLLKDHAASFPAFRRANGNGAAHNGHELSDMSAADKTALLAHARDRYFETSGLFGTPEKCSEMVERLRAIGVDEIACLADFGVPTNEVLASLPLLDRVRRRAQENTTAAIEPQPAASIADEIRTERVTHLQCTPSMARMLCADDETREALRGVRHLFVGGEALPEQLARELSAVCATVTNMYGPTETTIWSSTFVASDSPSDGAVSGTVPIGRPLANTTFYVLDEHLQPLPIGVAGELAIGGSSVARGYLRRPELDAQRFVRDPFARDGDARMYRTGDLVRYRGDGVVEFLGRTDHQIKVRGHRIEPGEIESALTREPSIAEAVVVAREDTPGDQRLVAYAVVRGAPVTADDLRAKLAAQLPESMVPAQIAFLDAIPRTPNGKVDRNALPQPKGPVRALDDIAPPASEFESRLAQLWRETLGVERVGVEDNFFDLGGHSLLAVRIHRRLKELASAGELAATQLSLTDLFRFPTIRSLAQFLSSDVEHTSLDEASLRGKRRRMSMLRRRQRANEA